MGIQVEIGIAIEIEGTPNGTMEAMLSRLGGRGCQVRESEEACAAETERVAPDVGQSAIGRSGVSVHSAAVHVHVHEEAMQLEHEGLDENEDEYEDGEGDGYVDVYGYGNENGHGCGNDEPSGQPGDAGASQ